MDTSKIINKIKSIAYSLRTKDSYLGAQASNAIGELFKEVENKYHLDFEDSIYELWEKSFRFAKIYNCYNLAGHGKHEIGIILNSFIDIHSTKT